MSKKNILYGINSVSACLQQNPHVVTAIYVTKTQHKKIAELISLSKKHNIALHNTNSQQLDGLCNSDKHQGIACQIQNKTHTEADLKDIVMQAESPLLFLILDCIQDPHNLGACIRSANAAGVDAVIAPKDKSSPITPVVRKVASGGLESTPFISVTNLARTIEWLKQQNIMVFGTAGEANQSIYQADLTDHTALVLGSEGKGMRPLIRKHCDQLVNIPMLGTVESLNVSVATGICLFEAVRQRSA